MPTANSAICSLYQGLVVFNFWYALSIQTLSNKHFERLKIIQNEAMRIILGYIRDTNSCVLSDSMSMLRKIEAG
jgi:hypothetical protein